MYVQSNSEYFPFHELCNFIFFSIGGLILDTTVSDPNLVGIVVYTPVINGKNYVSSLCLLLGSSSPSAPLKESVFPPRHHKHAPPRAARMELWRPVFGLQYARGVLCKGPVCHHLQHSLSLSRCTRHITYSSFLQVVYHLILTIR